MLRWQVGADGALAYIDDRGERDHTFPPSHDFEWTPATRDDHVLGRHPHISIQGEVFVETVGGDLTIKIENNTETGEGVYREPVAEPLQSLADADVQHARVGPLILLRVRPYNETEWRHLVFNTRTRGVVRLDGIGQACRRLPEDQGIIFPGGYHLSTGAGKTFDTDVSGLEFERVIRSANGEDVLYVFHARTGGRSLLLPYNVIRKQVSTPLSCHGYSLFDDGTLIVFRATSDEPSRVHPMQVWQTPYMSDLYAAPVLAPLSTRDRGDIRLLVRLAQGDPAVRADQLSHPYSPVELGQVLTVLRGLLRLQRVVLAGNRAYIASAAQADASRTEPPFQLQGSYRNMNKLAARVVPVMNDAELEAVIDDHYLGEAQTLTSGAEANLLKLAELRGTMTAAQAARWAEVKAAYLRERALGGAGDDPVTRAVGAVGLLADRVSTAIEQAADRLSPEHGPGGTGRLSSEP